MTIQQLWEKKGDNHCYFWSIVYFPTGSQGQHFAFRESLCTFVTVEHNLMLLQSCIPPEYKTGSNYINKIKLGTDIWGDEVMILATAQMTGKVVVTFIQVSGNGIVPMVCHATNYQLHSWQLVALPIRQYVKCLIIKFSIQVVTMVTNHS